MNSEEKIFQKYKTRGSDYHWKEIHRWNLFLFNAYLFARYSIISQAIADILQKERMVGRAMQSLIDFGCGDGVQLHTIQLTDIGKSIRLYGIDLSEEAIEVTKKKIPSANIQIASTYESGFPSNNFDISLSSDVIEHVLDPEKMINEMIRVTKPGGFILIATPIRYTEKPIDTMHVQEFFPEEFSRIFRKRKDVVIRKHFLSHTLKMLLLYNTSIRIFGTQFPLAKYAVNILFLLLGWNPFQRRTSYKKISAPSQLMTYQYVILQKNQHSTENTTK